MRMVHVTPLVAAFAASLSISGPSLAATTDGFALDRFEPSERGSGWFTQDTLDLRGHLRPAAGLVFDYADKPLSIYGADGARRGDIVADQFFAHLGAAFTLFDRLRFAFNLPIAVHESGDGGTVNGVFFPAVAGPAAGDLRLGGDVRLLGEHGSAFTLAVGLQAWVPTGSRSKFTGDGKFRVAPRVQAAGQIGPFAYGARVGFDYRALSDKFDGGALGSSLTFGLSAGASLLDGKLVLGPELFGSTVVENGGFLKRASTPVEVLVGAHYTLGDFRVGAGVGPGLSRGFGAPVFRGLLSVEWAPGYVPPPPDRDADSIPDAQDACADVKGVASTDPKKHGCPPDRDDDGIADARDACADVKGVASTDPKKHGCPPDRDEDGVADALDACPDVKGAPNADAKKNGCPPDRDEDGIADAQDACPDVKGGPDADAKKNGCPPDGDGDGIPDDNDACPKERGVADPDPKKHGCNPDRDADEIKNDDDACPDAPGPKNPDRRKNGCPAVAIVGAQIKIIQQVKFRSASDVILPESDKLLSEVAKILKDHPEITKVRVEGHTDNQGNAKYNKQLSERRAASVVKWLVTKGGIDKSRLSSQGFGQERPLDGNESEAGRQNNRRVEFHIESPEASGAK